MPPLIKYGVVYTSPVDECNILNIIFTHKARLSYLKPSLPLLIIKTEQRLALIQTNEDVKKIVNKLDITKSSELME